MSKELSREQMSREQMSKEQSKERSRQKMETEKRKEQVGFAARALRCVKGLLGRPGAGYVCGVGAVVFALLFVPALLGGDLRAAAWCLAGVVAFGGAGVAAAGLARGRKR